MELGQLTFIMKVLAFAGTSNITFVILASQCSHGNTARISIPHLAPPTYTIDGCYGTEETQEIQ